MPCMGAFRQLLVVAPFCTHRQGATRRYSGDHKFVQNNAAFLLANLSMSRVNLAVL